MHTHGNHQPSMHWVGSWHSKRGISLGVTHEVYAAALLGGLKKVLDSAISQVVPGIHICLDILPFVDNLIFLSNCSNRDLIMNIIISNIISVFHNVIINIYN